MFTVIIVFGILSTVAAVGTARALRVDGHRRVPTRTFPRH